jgi:N-acetyl sugar amidotransferase
MPETKPDLTIYQDGVCSACRSFEAREEIDWDGRQRELSLILERFRGDSPYDCLIPVSGGKDSTFQVIRLLGLGANPLCVTATTDHLTDLGRRNIENLQRLGVDHIEVTPNPMIRRKINRFALERIGDISWPEHVAIFTIPVRMAVALGIRLIVWGENPQNEYGGPAAAAKDSVLNRRWMEEFGGLLGLRVSDLIGHLSFDQRDLAMYTYPSDEELQRIGVTGVFLGYFFPWDGYENAMLAQAAGFETYPKTVEGSLVNYENLDNACTGIHDYFKFLKYGFGRATDIACLHIRRGRLTRSDALRLVRRHDGKFPWSYLGVPLSQVLEEIDLTLERFVDICDQFTNRALFLTTESGQLIKDREGNLTKTAYDNV